MLDELRSRLAGYLARCPACVLTTAGSEGAWATLVHCHSRGLEVECLLPRWADAAYHLAQDPRVLLVMPFPPPSIPPRGGEVFSTSPSQGGIEGGLRWLEVRGAACSVAQPDWTALLPGAPPAFHPAERYQVVRVASRRIDLFDEGQGWGARETLEV